MESSESKPRRRKEKRPEEIVQAAAEIFRESGFANAKIVDIAKRAGAAKGTIYLYFDTKDKLFEAVVHQFIRPIFARIEELVASFQGPTDELVAHVVENAYTELVESDVRRTVMHILIAEGSRFPNLTSFYYKAVIAGAEQMMRSMIKRGIDRGEFRPDILAYDYPGTLVGPVVMAAVWKVTFEAIRPLDLKQFAKAHVDLILNGLRRRRGL